MRHTEQSSRLLIAVRQWFHRYSPVFRAHPRLSLLGVVLLVTGLGLGLLLDGDDKQEGQLLEDGQTLPLQDGQAATDMAPVPLAASLQPIESADQNITSIATDQPAPPPVPTQPLVDWQPVTVSSGDTLGAIFKQRALSPSLVHNIVTLNDDTSKLTRLNVGEVLDIAYADDGRFQALRRAHTEQDWLIVEQSEDGLTSRMLARDLITREREANGVITGNLFVSGQEAGMSDQLIMNMARIFGWDIDFALDIRRGDRFVVIYEEVWRDGEYLRDGEIVAASFVNRGEVFQALRYVTDDGIDYFTPEGKPMRKAFLRTPLDFARVTSNFNPRRMHPVLKRVRPHNGVDYGAPTGTPVYASGDGTVIASAYSAPNGNYVFIRHTNDIVTKYLHFSRRAVNKGQRVKQGQTIGYVGSTGLATAPHLHYEFVVGGRHRNPRTVDLPEAIPLSDQQTLELLAQHQTSITRLEELDARQLSVAVNVAAGQ